MIFIYLICFLLIAVGVVLLLKLTPDRITEDIMKFASPKQTLKDQVLIAKRKKRSRKLTVELNRIRDALQVTGKNSMFTIVCASSLVLLMLGCVVAVAIGNAYLVPVLAVAFACVPFIYAKKTINFYDNRIKEELETALSIITTSYTRTDNIVNAVRENLVHLKPPVRDIFATFVAENIAITSDVKKSIRNLRDKISNGIFHEWCDTLLVCQDDRTLKDTLQPIVSKLTDVRVVNNDLRTMIEDVRKEYYMMVILVVGNIPLLYFLNKEWYSALMHTTLGKIVLALSGAVIIITAILMSKFTKPVEYKR